jgi:hypothetical protein
MTVDCYIGNAHPTAGCHGMNAFLNDLATIPLGHVLLHLSALALISLAVAAWSLRAIRSEARYAHTPGGERSLTHAYWLSGVFVLGTAVWLVIPEQGFQFYNALWLHLGGHS